MNRKSSIKRIMICLLALFVISTLISGCRRDDRSGQTTTTTTRAATTTTSQGTTSQTETTQETSYPLPLDLPFGDGSQTLKVAINIGAGTSDYNSLPVFIELEKRTGVKVDWEVLEAAQWQNVLRTRLAAATDLPDILRPPDSPIGYGQQGLLIPVNELIDMYAPSYSYYFEMNPFAKTLASDPETGLLYSFNGSSEGQKGFFENTMMVRQDWLDKLNLEAPKTVDDYYTVFRAFLTRDPNENGLNDEIPYTDGYAFWRLLEYFAKTYEIMPYVYSKGPFYINDEGIVEFAYLRPEMKEVVTIVRNFQAEGFLDPQLLVNENKWDVLAQQIATNIVGSTMGHAQAREVREDTLKEAVPEVEYTLIYPPEESGFDIKFPFDIIGGVSLAITKDCKDPVLATKWIDYFIGSPEGVTLNLLGLEGVTYQIVNGEHRYTEEALSFEGGRTAALRAIGAFAGFPGLNLSVWNTARREAEMAALSERHIEEIEIVSPYIIPNYGQAFTVFTQQEAEIISDLYPDIETYFKETITKMIYGQQSIDDWDSFVTRLKSMGIEDLLAVRQAQYDRIKP